MARTISDLEAFLQATGRPVERKDDGTFLLVPRAEVQPIVAIRADGPVMTTTVEIGPAPTPGSPHEGVMLRRLLELNASDLLYCAYGLKGEVVVLSSAHELENLDLNEVQAILSDIELALTSHLKQLVELSGPAAAAGDKLNMGVFARLAQLIKANINDLIDKAEDPEKMLEQVIIEMNGQLVENRKRVAEAITDEKHLQRLVEKEAAEAADWERRAMLAVRQGDDGLARDALERKKHHGNLAKQYEDQWQKQKASVDQLKTALRMLNDKIEEAKRNKNLLKARLARAKAQQQIHETMHGLKDNSAFDQFERLKQKVDRMEAEAEANVELTEENTGDRLAQQFRDLEQAHVVDDDLLALKQKMGVAPPTPEPAPPQPVRVKAPVTPAPAPSTEDLEREEFARALEELQAEEQRERERIKR